MKTASILGTLLGASGFLLIAIGCTGGPNDGGASSSSGSSGGGDGGGGGGDASCSEGVLSGQRACVPGTGTANTELTIQAEGIGCVGGGTSLTACNVAVNGQTITLTLESRVCTGGPETSLACGIPQTTCKIPPLAAGDYTIDFAGDEPNRGRELVIGTGSSASSCSLNGPGGGQDPIAADDYDKSCTVGNDDTCTLVSEGDPCASCNACPTAAIATSAVANLESDRRARRALCVGDQTRPACAPCPPTIKAVCNANAQCVTEPL